MSTEASLSQNPCAQLRQELLQHADGTFDDMSQWMRKKDTQEITKEALTKVVACTNINPRVCLAMSMMACNPEETFDQNRTEDKIMCREAIRFHKTLVASLQEHEEKAEQAERGEQGEQAEQATKKIDESWKRASRFYMAWMRQDKTHTLEQLMASVVARRARNVQSPESEEPPPEETFAQIRLLGGETAAQEALRMYAGAWRPVQAQNLASSVAEVAQRAFWDAIAQHTADGNYDSLFSVLGEIEESMRVMISYSSERQEDLKDKFDPAHLKQQVDAGALELDDVKRLIRYLAETIASWHASVDATDAAEWVASINQTIDQAPQDLGAFLISVLLPFLRDVVNRLQHLYGRVLQAGQEMEAARASAASSASSDQD